MGTQATTYFKIRSPEEKKRFKMSQKLLFIFVVILALSLIVSEAAPQWRRNRHRNRGYGGFGGGNARQTLKQIGGKKIIGGLALKGFGAITGNQGIYNLGKTITGLGVAKTLGAHLFNGK